MFHRMSSTLWWNPLQQNRRWNITNCDGITLYLRHVKHVRQIDVIARQFVPQIGNYVLANCLSSTHYETRQVPRYF